MSTAEAAKPLRVVVAWSAAPREVTERELALPAGATVQDAVSASGIAAEWPEWRDEATGLFVWGRAAPLQQTLHAGDRVEVLRGLRVDPKVARRERFAKQGARTAGLFSRRGRPANPR